VKEGEQKKKYTYFYTRQELEEMEQRKPPMRGFDHQGDD
jgi:hypothetical protein